MGAKLGSVKLYNNSSKAAKIINYEVLSRDAKFVTAPAEIASHGAFTVVQHQSPCTIPFYGSFSLDFGVLGILIVKITEDNVVSLYTEKPSEIKGKGIRAYKGLCVCICFSTHCSSVCFYDDGCGPDPPDPPDPDEKRIKLVFENNTTLVGDLEVIQGETVSPLTLPGAGGTIEPVFESTSEKSEDPIQVSCDVKFPTDKSFHVKATYGDKPKCDVSEAGKGDIVAECDEPSIEFGSVMIAKVGFFLKNKSANGVYLMMTNSTPIRGYIKLTDVSLKNEWLPKPYEVPGIGSTKHMIIGSLPLTDEFTITFGNPDDEKKRFNFFVEYDQVGEPVLAVGPDEAASIACSFKKVSINGMVLTASIEFSPK